MKKLRLYSFLGAACVSLAACGNAVFTEVIGHVGFSINESGGIVIVVESCGVELDNVSLAGPNIDGVNHTYAEFTAETPVSGYFEVDISNPGPNWKEEIPAEAPQDDDELLIGNAYTSREDIMPYNVVTELSEIRALRPGEIMMGVSGSTDGESSIKIVTREEFSRCD